MSRPRPVHGPALLLAVLLLGAADRPARAQDAGLPLSPIPVSESAEAVFETALQAFEEGAYETAANLFGTVANDHSLHRRTTAALLMRGKALYRNGDYQVAADEMARFIEVYPTSSYIQEANRLLMYALERVTQGELETRTIQLGIMLPLDEANSSLSQELFNGIRLAVNEFNEGVDDSTMAALEPLIRMVFQDTRNAPERARQAVGALVDEQVDAIIGPLFSEEAEAAAAAAEAARLVLVAPLATEDMVSAGRHFVFQANPTPTMRGRLMARFAMNSLVERTLGVISEVQSPVGNQMVQSFATEVQSMGGTLLFDLRLDDSRDWFRLGQFITRDSLAQVDAVYMPITGNTANTLVEGALGSLARMNATPRVLGNSVWHGLPVGPQASAFNTYLTNDFHVNDTTAATQHFVNRYQALTGEAPTRLAYTGYDVAHFLLAQLTNPSGQPLHQQLHNAGAFQGLGIRIDFTNGNVNEAMFYHRYRDGLEELIR